MPKKKPQLKAQSLAPNMDEERANQALDRRNEADYRCYLLLSKLARTHSLGTFLNKEEDPELMEEIDETLHEREDANDEFCRAIIGHPKST